MCGNTRLHSRLQFFVMGLSPAMSQITWELPNMIRKSLREFLPKDTRKPYRKPLDGQFIRPVKFERSCPIQPLQVTLVPGKRKPFIKKQLPPIVPVIDNRKWYTVSQVRTALAENRLHESFANQALAEARAYEQHFRTSIVTREYTYQAWAKNGRIVPTVEREKTSVFLPTEPSAWEGETPTRGKKKAIPAGTARAIAPALYAKYLRAKTR